MTRMTNQEAIEYAKRVIDLGLSDTTQEFCERAINALSAMDNIRQEIRKLPNANPSYWHTCDVIEREEVLDIIDEYLKGETE